MLQQFAFQASISPCKKNWLIKKARKIFSNNSEKVSAHTSLMKKRGAVVIYFLFNRSSKVQNIHIIIMSRVGQKCRFQNQFSTCLSSCTVINFHTTTCQIIFYYSSEQEHNGKKLYPSPKISNSRKKICIFFICIWYSVDIRIDKHIELIEKTW